MKFTWVSGDGDERSREEVFFQKLGLRGDPDGDRGDVVGLHDFDMGGYLQAYSHEEILLV